MSPRENFGPAQPSRKTAKAPIPNGKKVGTAGYKKLLFVPDGMEELGGEGSGRETEHGQDSFSFLGFQS